MYTELRGARRQRRKRYSTREWRARVVSKRPITARPAIVERRCQVGHWEADTLLGDRKSTRLNSSHIQKSRMPSSA